MKKIFFIVLFTFIGLSNSMVLPDLEVKGVSVCQHNNGWYYLVVMVSDVVVETQTVKGLYYLLANTPQFDDVCKSLIAKAMYAHASGKKIKAKITVPGGNVGELNTFLPEYPPSTTVRQADWLMVSE
jgi:hypothetical protein